MINGPKAICREASSDEAHSSVFDRVVLNIFISNLHLILNPDCSLESPGELKQYQCLGSDSTGPLDQTSVTTRKTRSSSPHVTRRNERDNLITE